MFTGTPLLLLATDLYFGQKKKKPSKVRMIIFLNFVEYLLALCGFIAVLILKVDDCFSVVT